MKAYLISIGDELLIGQTVNTNAAFIGSALSDINIDVIKSSVVADSLEEILNEFHIAFQMADVIIATGGLGPTHDDITRTAVIKFFDTELVMDEKVFEDLNEFFKSRGRELLEINKKQALIPKNSIPIRNTKGTSPGFWIEEKNKFFIVLPGVPIEMKEMMSNFVIPELKRKNKSQIITQRLILQTTGIPESVLYERLGNLEELLDGGKLAFLPNQYGVKIRITVQAENENECSNKLVEIEQRIRGKVGRYIYARGEELLEETIGKILTERNLTLAVAESCTGGFIASRITDISGSSNYFERGVVAYSNAAKVEILKVNEDTIQKFGAVSPEVAMQMAEGIRAISGADIGLSTTGIMGPTGATYNKPLGLVYIGYCDEKVCYAKKFLFGNDRIINKQRTSQAALEMLRRNLLRIPDED
ncbi:MAG: competence/damage-inducible protein A [Ignavibacterium sp.]|nr:competence/damage-inducible protein A [Ignavibacterium sp.]MDW8374527.1 competence/damage-inducible protein A [Ignavibacteriales bacterium]